MLNKNDFKYIIKRLIIYLSIAVIIMCLGSCKAHALVLPKPSQANLQMNDNGTTRYLTNYNINQFITAYYNEENHRFYKLIDSSNQNLSTITHVNVTYSPEITGPVYTDYMFYVSGIDMHNTPLLSLTAVYSYDNNTHNYNLCDIDYAYTNVDAKIYKIRCYTTESIQQFSFNFACGSYDTCFTTPTIDFGIEEFGYYTTNMQDAATIEAISDLQRELINNQMNQNNQNIDSSEFNSNLSNLITDSSISNNTITNLIILPITLLNSYYNNWNSSGTCQRIDLGTLYGTHLYLPCINLSNYLGSTLWVTIDCLMSGFLILAISKKMIKTFDDLTNLRTNQSSELYGGGA